MSEKHIIHHRGSPRKDPDSGDGILYIIGALMALGAAVTVFNAIILILPFLLAAGVISGATYAFLSSQLAKVKFKQRQLSSLNKKIIKSRNAESNAENATEFLSRAEKANAVEAAANDTEFLLQAYDDKKDEILELLESSLKRLKNSRKSRVLQAKNFKSPEKFRKKIAKLDSLIGELESSIKEIKYLTP